MKAAFAALPPVAAPSPAGARRDDDETGSRREALLAAVVVLCACAALATEALGALRAISAASVSAFWLMAAAIVVVAGLRRLRRTGALAAADRAAAGGAPASLRKWTQGASRLDAALLASTAAYVALLLVVAWLSPPQSPDSIGYHMARVQHWIANASLAHYPTHDPPQLFEPPLAEMLRLHLQLLTGGDRAGMLLQWLAMTGCLAGASLVARDFGGGLRAQVLAAMFAITLPIGVAQASSGKNGWLETLWLLSFVHFAAAAAGRREARAGQIGPRAAVLLAGAAIGLELTTKITAWLFAPPFVVAGGVAILRAGRLRPMLPALAAAAALAVAIPAPYLARNLSLYGHPLVDPVFHERGALALRTPAAFVSNVVRNAAYQLGTGVEAADAAIFDVVSGLHRRLGLAVTDRRTTQLGPFVVGPPAMVEETAFNPLHLLLAAAAAAVVLSSRGAAASALVRAHLAALVAAYVLYCFAVKFQPPGCRLLMPLLVLAAPLVAVAFERRRPRTIAVVCAVLVVAGLPWAVALATRPLSFGEGGLLSTPRRELYFARVPWLRESYEEIAAALVEKRTRRLGVVFTEDSEPEYLLWMLLAGTDPPVDIRNVAVGDASASLAGRAPFGGFRPERIAVFADGRGPAAFEPRIAASGVQMKLVRRWRAAALYEP